MNPDVLTATHSGWRSRDRFWLPRVHTARALVEEATARNIRKDHSENGAITPKHRCTMGSRLWEPGCAREMATRATNLVPNSPAATAETALAFCVAGDTAEALATPIHAFRTIPLLSTNTIVVVPEIFNFSKGIPAST